MTLIFERVYLGTGLDGGSIDAWECPLCAGMTKSPADHQDWHAKQGLPRPAKRELVLNELRRSYGDNVLVAGVAERILTIMEAHDEDMRQEVINTIWAAWSGGGAAERCADRIIAMLEFA